MTEALYKSSDVPNFDAYPLDQPQYPPESGSSEGSVLIHRAEQIGTALGSAVSNLRKARKRLQELGDQTAQTAVIHMSELAGAAKTKAHEFGQEVKMKASEFSDVVADKARQMGERTKHGYFRARQRANDISRDYPIQTLVAVGLVAVLVGTGIRVWRANRAE